MQAIRVRVQEHVTTVILDRPHARNAYDDIAIAELAQVFSNIPETTRVAVLTGRDPIFCAGADVAWMKRSINCTEAENYADVRAMARMLRTIDECPCPVIARVNGHCLGGGMGLIGASDIVVSIDSALFGYREVKLGVDPAILSPVALPKIGERYARRYYLTGERFTAAEAARIGLVHEVVPAALLDQTINTLIREILEGGPIAVRAAKKWIREILPLDREQAEDLSVHSIASLRVTPEGQEGFGAFLERRKPNWVPDHIPDVAKIVTEES
jgi:methylglutaconyl-CoA hydratase